MKEAPGRVLKIFVQSGGFCKKKVPNYCYIKLTILYTPGYIPVMDYFAPQEIIKKHVIIDEFLL